MKKFYAIVLAAVCLSGCKPEKAIYQNPHFATAEHAASRIAVVSDSCHCLAQVQIDACTGNATQASIINQYLNNSMSVTKTVHWANCTTNLNVNDPNCNAPYTNVTSQLVLCWHSCTSVTARFIGKPPCLPCYPENFCMVLAPQKTVNGANTSYILTGTTSVFDVVQIKLVISTDPDVIVQCGVGPAGNQTIYTCNGSY